MKFLLNTTTWENSGLATVGHTLVQKILSRNWQNLLSDNSLKQLQLVFSRYYQLPSISLPEIRRLLKYYQHPEDQQKLMMGPLKEIADDIALLCQRLRISLTSPTSVGYKGSDPFCQVEAVDTGSHWQPVTESMGEAFRQQLVWKQGFRFFTHHSSEEIKQAARAVLLNPIKRKTSAILQKAITTQGYKQIAEFSKVHADNPDPNCGFYPCIDKAIETRDFSALLSIFYFKPSSRNAILHKALSKTSTGFVSDFLKYYSSLPQGITDTKNWTQELDKVLPIIQRTAGDTHLHIAIRKKDTITAKKLLLKGEDIYQPNNNDVSALHLACAAEDQYLIQAMMDNDEEKNKQNGFLRYLSYVGIDLSQQDASGNTPLHYAAGGNNPQVVEVLLKQYVPIVKRPVNFHKRNNQGRTPIHIAALNPQAEILRLFLNQQHQFPGHHDQDEMGLTPLHYAAAAKNKDNIRLLLSAGASLTTIAYPDKVKAPFVQRNSKPNYLTPLWISLEVEDLDGAALLVKNADHLWNTQNSQGYNALQLAARLGRIDLLTAWNKQFNHSNLLCSPDDKGKRLIHYAAEAGQVGGLKYLLSQGEWLTRPDHRGNTPLHYAAEQGHEALVQFICDEAKKEQQHNSALAKQGRIKETLLKKRIIIQLDGENSFAETPHLLAQIQGHDKITKRLERAGARPVPLSDYLKKAIYRRTGDDVSKSEYKAACIVAKRHNMALETDADLNTYVHHAVKAGNYRAILILLHPLKPEQRKALVSKKNKEGYTPLHLLKQIRRVTKDDQQLEALDKIERALIRYDELALQRKYPTAVLKGQYYDRFASDFKEELERTSAYYYASLAAQYGPMVLEGIKKAVSTGNLFSLFFGTVDAFFAGDMLSNLERSLSLFVQKYPAVMPGVVGPLNYALRGIGWYRQTTNRFIMELTRQISARLLSQSVLEGYDSDSKNFIDFLNCLALLHATVEEVGRYNLANPLSDYWQGAESSLVKIGAPKVNDVIEGSVQLANDAVKELVGVDVTQTVLRAYGSLRENWGSLPSKGAELLEVIDTEIMADLGLTVPSQQDAVKKVFEVTIDQFRHEPKKLEQVINGLRGYLLTGVVAQDLLPLLSQTATGLTAQNQNAGECLAPLVIAGPLYKNDLLTDDDRTVIQAQVAEAINTGKAADMFDKGAARCAERVGQNVVTGKCLPDITTQDTVVRDLLQQGLQALFVNAAGDVPVFENDFSAISLYVNQGVLTPDIAKSLDRLASALVSEGKNYSEVIQALTLQNGFYQSFQGDVKLTSYADRLQNSLAVLQNGDPNERGEKLYAALVKEHQYVIDTAVQSLQSGRSVGIDYQNILKQSDIRSKADGAAEYFAQILVFNNTLSFGGLTYEQKCQMQSFYKAYFKQVQGSANKANLGAVAKNYDLAKTFHLVAPYMELILSGAPVEANIPGIFAQWDPMVVRAAVAAHQVAAMANTTTGYSALNDQQTFNLFRKFYDQQFASSTTKVEQGMLDIVNETLRSHDQTGGHFQAIWGEHTLDGAAQLVSNSSKQIAENRWQGTNDAYARSLGNNNKGKVHRFVSSAGKDLRHGLSEGTSGSTLGGNMTGSTVRPAFFHTPSGTETVLNFPITGKGLTFEMTPKAVSEPLGKVVPPKDIQTMNRTPMPREDTQKPIYVPSWTQEQRTPIFTPLLAANDVRPSLAVLPTQPLGKAPPQKDIQKSAIRAKERHEREATVAMLLSPPQSKGSQVKLLPELTEPLLTLPVLETKVTTPPKLSLGDRLLGMIGIGRAEANPVVMVGAAILEPSAQTSKVESEPTSKSVPVKALQKPSPEVKPRKFDRFIEHVDGFNRGFEKARDGFVDSVLHPIQTVVDTGTLAWDCANAVTDLTLGVSSSGSRERNTERGEAIRDMAERMAEGDSVQKTEIITELGASLLFGAVGGAATGGVTGKVAKTLKNPGKIKPIKNTGKTSLPSGEALPKSFTPQYKLRSSSKLEAKQKPKATDAHSVTHSQNSGTIADAAGVGVAKPPRPYAPDRPLPVNERSGTGIPDPEALGYAYTQLGTKNSGRNYKYTKAREFDANGVPVRDIEFTNHRRKDHPDPHQHRWLPNETGGTRKRGDPEPLDTSLAQDLESIKDLSVVKLKPSK